MHKKLFIVALFIIARTCDYSKFVNKKNRVNRYYICFGFHLWFPGSSFPPKLLTETLIFSCLSVLWLSRKKFSDPSHLTIIKCSTFQRAPAPNLGGRNTAETKNAEAHRPYWVSHFIYQHPIIPFLSNHGCPSFHYVYVMKSP